MKRKVLVIVSLVLALALLLVPGASALTAEELLSEAVMLLDAKTGEILFSKNPDEQLSMASTTKIMTLILSIEMSAPDEIVTIPECVEDIGFNSTRVPVYYGEIMPLQDLWYGLIFKSGNDAANAIAHHEAGSVEAFVKMMNEKAGALGMTGTHYANPHGYTAEGHYTTARDMSKLAMYCLKNDLFREITFGDEYTLQATSLRDKLTIYHDYPINDYDSMYYYQYSRGIKTGYTQAAGQCFVGAAIKGDKEILVVMLRCGWEKLAKWPEAKKLYQYGFEVLDKKQ